ncbi:bifunctional diaminohydroxyphosphoribosylaminopyrimidine deaminase/5-amino-6-(5-phosphoribosylamino)uracil reductase RibD [Paenibacillus sp. CF384]|uniref:bifunctional diaminohydroxyphosphoribosylaminopyrimidine deaminase/5-amino-6-(5-phosphoribosylamino)uracil reductase RibD n=1 Tax=Paenibacillus sp. CF384 TaxID=1884382 RepID=UPI000898D975|nr:bifunctional diaminohydroxyphosphoribosylaminopyrimidine deaminase/5-amino-6-(5-phosphoribosylamino)uracil reductase RibD [Paenibacillus sp. CF384]SDW47487.1 diaminohydroxyphosphoribosylaminopyrimidine deaminase / 5-amino-6-(5-phosphoribosylamino)uracil reductase [Paenibacillus sp. CF384]
MDHEFYMRLALENAMAMKGQTDPNPLVGSVIVKWNRIVGVGVHMKAGEPHAEIHAIHMAGDHARGATIYVTLEPCSHYGQTGPCAMAIIEAGIKEVVIATLDPNPLVSGKGVQRLRDAGIDVIIGVCENESRKMNEVFNKFIVHQIPFVTLKSAITMDGKIASFSADSKWITSHQAREDVHLLRNQNAAILVGVNTVILDDPQLTTRLPNGRNPVRVILDSTLRLPLKSKVVVDGQAPTWVFTTKSHDPEKRKALNEAGVHVMVTEHPSKVNPSEVLQLLGERHIASLLIEGGSEINSSFVERRLVDKVVLYMAPKLIGGRNAPMFLAGTGIEKMRDAIDLSDASVHSLGNDFKFTGYPVYVKG